MAESISYKVEEYERFLNERLRTDVKRVLERKDGVNGDIAELLQLKATIQHLMTSTSAQKSEPLKTMVDLGCNFYAKARVNDCSHIIVSIGMGFFLEMKLGEAMEYVDKKVVDLSAEADKLSEQASQINARIKIVLGALDELQFSSSSAEQRRYQ